MRSEKSGLMSKEMIDLQFYIFSCYINVEQKYEKQISVGYSMTHSISNCTVSDELKIIWKQAVIP
jgi:hypothetical protein